MKNENEIIIYKGPERVRKRPMFYFVDGVESVIKTLLNIFVSEAALGFSSGIDVTVHADNSIDVRSYDRGFVLDETIIDGKPAWYQDFCELYCGPRDFYGHKETPTPKCSVADYGLNDPCCVQYVSKFIHVEAARNDGTKKILDFEKGHSVSDLRKEQTSAPTGTFIHLLLDDDVFGDIINFPTFEFIEDF